MRKAAVDFEIGVNLALRQIEQLEAEAERTKDAGLMKLANEKLKRLCAVVDETDRELARLIDGKAQAESQ